MHKIINQKHPKYTFIYGIAAMFERAGYYGIRAVLVLYLTSNLLSEGGLEMSRGDAIGIYGTLAMVITFSKIFGGLLGDLVLKNKNALILGGILQMLGAFVLCIHATSVVYIAVGLIALGTGFYVPNMTAYFGRLYLDKTKLLDSAFTIYFGFINLGAFIGILAAGYLGEVYGWSYGFVLVGIFFLISILLPLLFKSGKVESITKNKFSRNFRISIIALVLVVVGLFKLLYELLYIARIEVQVILVEEVGFENSAIVFQQIESFPTIVLALVFGIIWSWYYNHQFIKMLIGFIFGALSFGVLFLIPQTVSAEHFWLFCMSLFFLSLAEIHLAPVINSIIIKYGNPKYLATLIALTSTISAMFIGFIKFFPNDIYETPWLALKSGFSGILVIIIILVIGILFGKKYLKD